MSFCKESKERAVLPRNPTKYFASKMVDAKAVPMLSIERRQIFELH